MSPSLRTPALLCLTATALLACGGASTTTDAGTDAGLPAFDGGPGTLWLYLSSDSVIGLDTRDGHQVKRFDGVGAATGGDHVLAVGAGKLWFQSDVGIRSLDLATGATAELAAATGSRDPAFGAGAVWWHDEGTLADPGPIYRYDPVSGATTHTNTDGIPDGTGGLIAAGPNGCWSLYSRMFGQEKGVAHALADGSANSRVVLTGTVGLGASVAAGGGRGFALTDFVSTNSKRLFSIDAATNTVTAQRDVTTPEFGTSGLLANEDHLHYADGSLWYVDSYGETFYELDPVTLATRRSLSIGTSPGKQGTAIGAGGAWSLVDDGVRRVDLGDATVVVIPLAGNVSTMVFEPP